MIMQGMNATCDCDPGWMGEGCGEPTAIASTLCMNNCSARGTCMNGTICLCDDGFVGEDCSMQMGVSACPYDCFGRGTCQNGTCACDVGFLGPACNTTDSSVLCAGVVCGGGEVPIWGNGTCHCLLDDGLSGGACPMNCSMRGSCFNGTCSCDSGFSGSGCEVVGGGLLDGGPGGGCVNNCSEHGSCFNGTCACDSGWTSEDCSVSVGSGGSGCPSNCTGHGACTGNNTCLCDPGWLGPDCSVNAISAPACAFNCSGNGECVNSTCACFPGFSGVICQDDAGLGSTPMPSFNSSSAFEDGASCPGDGTCSGHGSCNDGVCTCDPFWRGKACDMRLAVIIPDCPGDCSMRGTCLNGTCMCDPMWDGVDCSYPSLCPGYTHAGGDNCTGHGSCVNGTCLCDPTWTGVDCSIRACPVTPGMQHVCSGHGICGNGTCACDLGWTGPTCDEPGCPGDCNGHGICDGDNSFLHVPTCSCFPGWMGSSCNDPRCPTSMETENPYVPCSGNGACFQDGTCLCYENYAGEDCGILIDCSGRGSRKCGYCECDDGFDGELCEIDVCEDSRVYDPEFPSDYRMADVCSGRGRCTTYGGCMCDTGYAGRNCSNPAVCTGCTSIGGVCAGSRDSTGVCTCPLYDIPDTPYDTPRYTGDRCQFAQCPGYRGINSAGAEITCSGKGQCDKSTGQCTCFNVEGEGPYSGIDCGVPPIYRITNIFPQVGPLEGGTTVTLGGPGLERVFPLLAPEQIYCDFGGSTRTEARIGTFFDTIVCETPPVAFATPDGTPVQLTNVDGAVFDLIQGVATFEYFAQTRIIRITPSYGPLRPVGGPNEPRGPSATNQPTMVTVTGTYFPPNGQYGCKFGDCDAPAVSTVRVDSATIVCEMPPQANPGRVTVSVTSNGQQYSNTVGTPSTFSIFGIESISPKCASSDGTAMLTVKGQLLVDPDDSTRDMNNMWCRFGRVTLSGQTRSAGIAYRPGFKLFAFHSKAVPSERSPGALECPVPDWPIETSNFALSLSATYLETDALLQDGYYIGQWDATPAVTFDSFYQPEIVLRFGPRDQQLPHPFLIEPTLGPENGGTRVTVAGLGFDFARYGPNSGNDVYQAWSPPKPYCNAAPIPSCKFGSAVTRKVEILNNETVVCISPILPEQIEVSTTVVVSVALDGQTYSTANPAIFFQFAPQHTVSTVFPASGVRTGGTTLTVRGTGFIDANTGDDDEGTIGVTIRRAPRVLACVFISVDSPTVRFKASSTRFISPSEIHCVTPSIPTPGSFILDVSISGQMDDTQLSQSEVGYIFYQDPLMREVRDTIGSVNGGEVVNIVGDNFISLPTLACRFGTVTVPGTLVNGNIQCTAPAVDEPATVEVAITMNGFDYSVANPPLTYTFYDISELSPSSGPAHGGTYISVRIRGGDGFNHFADNGEPRFAYQAILGDFDQVRFAGEYDPLTDMVVFDAPQDAVTGDFIRISSQATGRIPFRLALTSSQTFRSFPGVDFVLYTARLRTVLPCMMGDCDDLVIPKNGVEYPVTFGGDHLVDLDTILCGYIPMSASSVAAGPAATFADFGAENGPPPITIQGTYNQTEDLVYCKAPSIASDAANEGYHVSIALNGQNFVGLDFADEVFHLIYLPIPKVQSLSVSGGLVSGGANVQVNSTMWNYPAWYKPNQAPPTLSCIFYLPVKGAFKFVDAQSPSCNTATGTCSATCTSPDFTGYADLEGVLVRSQVFISLNRRDPCMRCGCIDSGIPGSILGTDGFGADTCSIRQTDDRTTGISRFDPETQGFCSERYMVLSDAHFCRGSRGGCPLRNEAAEAGGQISGVDIDDVEFTCLGRDVYKGFTFYKPPAVMSLSPTSVAGAAMHNKTRVNGPVVAFTGSYFSASQWRTWPGLTWPDDGSIKVRATYMDSVNVTTVLDGSYVSAQGTKLRVTLPIPCTDVELTGPATASPALTSAQVAACYANTGVGLLQTLDKMTVELEISYNGGVQYTKVNQTFSVFKNSMCPTDGCGHGQCMMYDQDWTNEDYPTVFYPPAFNVKQSRIPTCFCGYWQDPATFCNSILTSNQAIDKPLNLNFQSCKQNILFYDANLEENPTYEKDPQGLYTLWDLYGRPAIWPHSDYNLRETSEIGCKAGPIISSVEPTIGILTGGTTVIVSYTLPPGMSWDAYTTRSRGSLNLPARLESFFVCQFASGGSSVVESAVPITPTIFDTNSNMRRYSCTAPDGVAFFGAAQSNTKAVSLGSTFKNPLGVLSPLLFEGTTSYTFSPLPFVTSIFMGVEDAFLPTINGSASIPLCLGDCANFNQLDWTIVLAGSGFVETQQLACRINGVDTRAFYINASFVRCTLDALPGANGTIDTPGRYSLEVSLNRQPNEWAYVGQIEVYRQPEVLKDATRGFGVDPGKVGTSLPSILGTTPCVDSQCNQKMNEYARLAPMTGGTPLVFYLGEPAGSTRVPQFGATPYMSMLFGECTSACPPGTPESEMHGPLCTLQVRCTCTGPHTSPVELVSPQSGSSGMQRYRMRSVTPSTITKPGRYQVCLAMNGIHYLPMYYYSEGGSTSTYDFRFYRKPIVTQLSTFDGPINIPAATYTLDLIGDNFPVKTPYQNCDTVDIGLCREFAPRIFVHIGTFGTLVGGYGSMAQFAPINYDSTLVNVTAGMVTMVMPDMSIVSINDFTGNVTVSFNGWDFTPVVKGVTEFSFYRIPSVTLNSLSPKWGHYDAETTVMIRGDGFQPTPGRSMCRISSCDGDCTSEGSHRVLVPATYVSSTQVACTMTARPPFVPSTPTDVDRSRQMFVSYTPDGRLSTLERNPVMYELIMYRIGKFSLSGEIKFMNVSATAAPTSGGTSLKLVVINHRFNQACLDMSTISTLVVGLVPTSNLWKIARPPEYGDSIPTAINTVRFQRVNELIGNFEANICLVYITVTIPPVPYPLEADIKISFNGGQQFTGPAMPILFYRPASPVSNIPTRGGRNTPNRPKLTVYFDSELFDGANPEYTVIQTVTAFSKTTNCLPIAYPSSVAANQAEGVCALGPKCRFTAGTNVVESPAIFTFDPFLPFVECTAPAFPVQADASISVSLDGKTFYQDGSTKFLFFNQPKVNTVLPTNGFWNSRTNILVEGTGFLETQGDIHLVWCIFDFQDILPKSQVWDVPRRWTKAFIYPNSNNTLVTCTSPIIADSERPGNINPRARVGVIIDGICQEADANGNCLVLKNSDASIRSDAFFVYSNIPTITKATPVAALSGGGDVVVTISGVGFMNSYTWGPPAVWNTETLPVGYETRPTAKLCVSNGLSSPRPCPGLSCRFGQKCPANGIGNCTDLIIDASLDSMGRVLCAPPIVDPNTLNATQLRTVGLSVSLNGMPAEFSNELDFTFSNLRVVGPLQPTSGISFGGGIVSVYGQQFVNTTCAKGSTADCLACRFTASDILQGRTHLVAAKFINSNLVSCVVPSTSVFGMDPATVPEKDVCLDMCVVHVSVTTNGIDFIPEGRDNSITYSFEKVVDFYTFGPNSGPTTGRTNITVVGRGFSAQTMVWCRIGSQIVKATYVSLSQMICMAPPVAQAVDGGVFIGFSINSVDFCEIVGPSSNPQCVFSTLTTAAENPFYYHDPIVATSIEPPSGDADGGTEVLIHGSGFSTYGQKFYARFKLEHSMECTPLSPTTLKCMSPSKPFVQDNQGLDQYIMDVAVPVTVTSNKQQYSKEESGQACTLNPDLIGDDNPQADCPDELFVMWTWFKLPQVTSIFIDGGGDVPKFNSFLNPDLYPDLVADQGELTIPQGPTSGGTNVVIRGTNFMSFARVELINGPGVVCPGGVKPAPPGESCTTTCSFPFRHAITATGEPGAPQIHYTCINYKRLADQGNYNPNEYWCAIHGTTSPVDFSGEYGVCRYQISSYRDFKQGGKVVTDLECLFGDKHVPAMIVDNSTIVCQTPPSDYGIVVPLSVTLNRRDYSKIDARTRFQYISPAPLAIRAVPDNQLSTIRITFDQATNKAGLLDLNGILRSDDPGVSGCTTILDAAFVSTLGRTAPTCRWLPGDAVLEITPTASPTFQLGDTVRFKARPCETTGVVANQCWRNRVKNDLLRAPRAKPGCTYPKTTVCLTDRTQSYDPDWCGLCIPDQDAEVEVISYPFNQSSTTLTISPPTVVTAPLPSVLSTKTVDSCTRLCRGGAKHGNACTDSGMCGIGGVCVPGLVTLRGSVMRGQAGRPLRFVRWTLDTTKSSNDPLIVQNLKNQLAAQSYTTTPITTEAESTAALKAVVTWEGMPAEDSGTVNRGKYCFMLTVTNWLGASGNLTACQQITRIVGAAVPSISIMGDSERSLTLSQSAAISSIVTPSACASNSTKLKFAWGVSPEPAGWSSSTFNKKSNSIVVPAYAVPFATGVPYTFMLNATLLEGAGTSETVSVGVTITFVASAPMALISGGNSRMVASDRDLVLDGSASYDVDKHATLRMPSDLLHCWSCVTLEGDDCDFTDEVIYSSVTGTSPYVPVLTVPSGQLLTQSEEYHVTLTVAKAAESRTCANVLAGEVPLTGTVTTAIEVSTALLMPVLSIAAPRRMTVDANEPILLRAYIESSNAGCQQATDKTPETCGLAGYEWNVEVPNSSPSSTSEIMKKPGAVGFDGHVGAFGWITVVIPPGSLVSGQPCNCYTFSLTAYDVDGSSNHASITLAFNDAPKSGKFSVTGDSAGNGTALATTFTFECTDWTDDPDQLPLTYQFFYTATTYTTDAVPAVKSKSLISLGGRQLVNSLETELPQGDLTSNNAMVVVAKIYDTLGAAAEVSKTITVKPDRTQTVLVRGTYLESLHKAKLEKLINNGDSRIIYRYISIIGIVMGDPDLKQERYSASLFAIRSSCIDQMIRLATPEPDVQRRSIAAYTPLSDSSEIVQSVTGYYTTYAGASPTTIDTTQAQSVIAVLNGQIAPTTTALGADTAEEQTTVKQVVGVLGILQDSIKSSAQGIWDNVAVTIKATLINYMRGKAGVSFDEESNGMSVSARRITSTVSDVTTDITILPAQNNGESVKFTNRILTGITGLSTEGVDVHVVAYNGNTNPYDSSGTQTVRSRVVSVNVFDGLPSGSATVPTTVAPLVIEDLAANHQVEIKLRSIADPPAKNKNITTGVFTATVCGVWNSSNSIWTQFHTQYLADADERILPCKTSHLSDFAAVDGSVGCNFLASVTPATLNKCEVCGGGDAQPMQGICDHEGVPCYVGKDRCGVCGGTNVSFIDDTRRNVTGVCDYRGVACGKDPIGGSQLIPTVCGVCDLVFNREMTQKNQVRLKTCTLTPALCTLHTKHYRHHSL